MAYIRHKTSLVKNRHFIDYHLFSANCYSYNPFIRHKFEGSYPFYGPDSDTDSDTDGDIDSDTDRVPFISIDSLESIPVKFMKNIDCRRKYKRFIKEDMDSDTDGDTDSDTDRDTDRDTDSDTEQYYKQIMCQDTKRLIVSHGRRGLDMLTFMVSNSSFHYCHDLLIELANLLIGLLRGLHIKKKLFNIKIYFYISETTNKSQ